MYFTSVGAAEVSKDQVVIQVMTGIPDGHAPEEEAVHAQDTVLLLLYLHPQMEHTPGPDAQVPGLPV